MLFALVLFALAAAGGAVLAVQRLKGRPQPSLGLAVVHGLAAAAGLILLGAVLAGGDAPGQAQVALGLCLAAALGGFALFATHLRKVALPVWLVVVHGLVAVVAFLVLLAGALG